MYRQGYHFRSVFPPAFRYLFDFNGGTSAQAHSVPLDLRFFFPSKDSNSNVSLPLSWAGDAFVTFHGSFDRTPPTGYGVVRYVYLYILLSLAARIMYNCRVPFTGPHPAASPSSTTGSSFLVQAANLDTCPGTCIRPVGLAFADDGRLFVSSDSSGELFIISKKN